MLFIFKLFAAVTSSGKKVVEDLKNLYILYSP